MAPGDTITSDGQIEWAGNLFGSGTSYRWLELTGWDDLPGLDSGNVLRPNKHGAWSGRKLSQERIVTWSARISTAAADFGAAVTAFRRALPVVDDDTEQALVIRTRGGETRLAYAAVSGRIIPNNPQAGIGRGQATVQWTASDPRLYGLDEWAQPIPQPLAGSGLTYPLTYPLTYGTAPESGARTVTNAGDTATPPTLVIHGPCTTPVVVNLTTGMQLELAVTMAASETLTVDVKAGTALLDGTDRQGSLTAASVPIEAFELTPGANDLTFRAAAFLGGSSLDLTWRDAYL